MATGGNRERPFFVKHPSILREQSLLSGYSLCFTSDCGHTMNSSPTGTAVVAGVSTEHRQSKLQGRLPDTDGLNFFSLEVDGEWRGGWFRIRNGILEVY